MSAEHLFPHQQVGHQDWHDNEEGNPEDVGHFWEGGQQATAVVAVAKNVNILKLSNGHHHGLDEGQTSIPKGGDIDKHGSIIHLQCDRNWKDCPKRYAVYRCLYN